MDAARGLSIPWGPRKSQAMSRGPPEHISLTEEAHDAAQQGVKEAAVDRHNSLLLSSLRLPEKVRQLAQQDLERRIRGVYVIPEVECHVVHRLFYGVTAYEACVQGSERVRCDWAAMGTPDLIKPSNLSLCSRLRPAYAPVLCPLRT